MKGKATLLILSGTILILAAALVGLLLYLKNQPPPQRGFKPLLEIVDMEPDSSKWGINFPNEYSTFLLTESNKEKTTYGGSELISKLEQDPRLVTIFAGYSFSKNYG